MLENLPEWKKNQRKQLIAAREAISTAQHQQWSRIISDHLMHGFPQLQNLIIGLYWPFRGEYDPRGLTQHLQTQGSTFALPEVVNKNEPLIFRKWLSDTPMKIGAYDIAVPDGTEIMRLDAIIVPMVGFDKQGYRLGYGSGYYDRTLATYSHRPLTIGVAFEIQRLENIYPQSHDISMQFIVTEAGIFETKNHHLQAI